jgi:hypothetical protein
MSQRLEHPPFAERESLANSLNDGELATWAALRSGLSPDWEIYAQARVLDVLPDFVLLNPARGVFIIEVKDVDLAARQRDWVASEVRSARIQVGRRCCEAVRGRLGRTWPASDVGVRTCVVFTRTSTADLARLVPDRQNALVPVFSGEELPSEVVAAIEGTSLPTSPAVVSAFQALRHYLVEPVFVSESRDLPSVAAMAPKQRQIVMNKKEEVSRRRVKGGAGAGKTIALAARAAELAKNPEKRILVICFNRSLVTYLRDTIAEYARRSGGERKAITIYHWHQWWSDAFAMLTDAEREQCRVPPECYGDVARQVLAAGAAKRLPQFDAVLIDEAQDLSPSHIAALLTVLRDADSEVLACFDGAQDVYSNSDAWSGDAFRGLGFRGQWFHLKGNERMPPRLAEIANRFARDLLDVHEENLLDVATAETLEESVSQLRWVQCSEADSAQTVLAAADAMVVGSQSSGRDLVAWADVVIATRYRRTALDIQRALEVQGRKVICAIEGDEGSREDQQAKSGFYKGDGRIKVSTIKSLKGFETSAMVIVVEPFGGDRDNDHTASLREVYTAITRLKARSGGSSLTVICAEPSLRDFGLWFNTVS